jgi:hypothetical protein
MAAVAHGIPLPPSLCCLEANTLITLPKQTATYIVCQKRGPHEGAPDPHNTKVLKNCFFVAEIVS